MHGDTTILIGVNTMEKAQTLVARQHARYGAIDGSVPLIVAKLLVVIAVEPFMKKLMQTCCHRPLFFTLRCEGKVLRTR